MENKEKQLIDPSSSTAQDMFSKILRDRIQDGALEKAIEKQVDNLIAETANDVFRSYSDLGKAIKEQLTSAIMPEVKSIGDLPVYHDFVANRLKVAAQNFYDTRLKDALDKELEQVFSEVPEQLTLSYIIERVLEKVKDDEEGEGRIALFIEENDCGSVIVSMDADPDTYEYSCAYRMHLSKNKDSGNYEILSLMVDDKDVKGGAKLCAGRLYDIDKILFNVYAMKGEIIINNGTDAEAYESSWCDWD